MSVNTFMIICILGVLNMTIIFQEILLLTGESRMTLLMIIDYCFPYYTFYCKIKQYKRSVFEALRSIVRLDSFHADFYP